MTHDGAPKRNGFVICGHYHEEVAPPASLEDQEAVPADETPSALDGPQAHTLNGAPTQMRLATPPRSHEEAP